MPTGGIDAATVSWRSNPGRRLLRHLMVQMGHDNERAAMIYQHKARGADQRRW
jgi:hypothetical protein